MEPRLLTLGLAALATTAIWALVVEKQIFLENFAGLRAHSGFQKTTTTTTTTEKIPIVLTCPSRIWDDNVLDYNEEEISEYNEEHEGLIASNLSYYVENFRTIEYDLWGYTYNDVKERLYEWKKRHFASLKSGDTIYESATGIGLNLLMTTEILHDEYQVHNLTIYGNEYLDLSVKIANELFERGIYPKSTKKGALCIGDSSNLSHVPSDSFDLVYTGYISPVWDPLNFGSKWEHQLDRICKFQNSHVNQAKVRNMQRTQEQWYDTWVQEMIRIAKPGAMVIVESVSRPYCDTKGLGGVAPDFWQRHVDSGAWRIVPESLVMDKDQNFSDKRRYHVAMQKMP